MGWEKGCEVDLAVCECGMEVAAVPRIETSLTRRFQEKQACTQSKGATVRIVQALKQEDKSCWCKGGVVRGSTGGRAVVKGGEKRKRPVGRVESRLSIFVNVAVI